MNGMNNSSMVRESVLQLLYRCCRCCQMMCIICLMFFIIIITLQRHILIIKYHPLFSLQLQDVGGGNTPYKQFRLCHMPQQPQLSPITAPAHAHHRGDGYQYHPALTTTTTDGSISNTIHSDPQFELMSHVINLRLRRDHKDLLHGVTSDEIDNIIKETGDLEATMIVLKEKLKELVEGGYSTVRPPNMDRTVEGANSLSTGMEPVYVANATNNSLSQQFGRQCEEESPRLYCFVICTRVFNMKSR